MPEVITCGHRRLKGQLVDKDPKRAIAMFWAVVNAGDRVDVALKDMAIVMKQQNRAEEAVEAIKSLRHRCSDQAQESLDNILLDLYKIYERLDDQIALLKHKLHLIQGRSAHRPFQPHIPHVYRVLAKLSSREWDRKVECLQWLGWYEEELTSAFAKHPYFMTASTEKLERNMGFFKEEMGWEAAYVAAYSVVLSLSFEKRIVPHCRVLEILRAERLFDGRVMAHQLMLGKEDFFKRKGSKSGASMKCSGCQGSGMKVYLAAGSFNDPADAASLQ